MSSNKENQSMVRFYLPCFLCGESVGIGCFIQLCSRALALREVPKCTRAAILLSDRVVSRRNRKPSVGSRFHCPPPTGLWFYLDLLDL
jgi:hypothetical protein